MPQVLTHQFYDPSKASDRVYKRTTPIYGTIKAMLPLLRESFVREQEEVSEVDIRDKFKKVSSRPIIEKRIFGIMTARQVGYIPNLQISTTEDELNFVRETFMFKTLTPKNLVDSAEIDLDNEIFKQCGVNDYQREDIMEDEKD